MLESIWKSALVSVLVLAGASPLPVLAAPGDYSITVIPSNAVAINDNSQVLLTDGIWENSVVTPIDLEPGDSVASINNAGQVTGSINPYPQPFIWENGVISDIGSLGGNGAGVSINHQGHIVGHSRTYQGGLTHAFLWDSTQMHDLGYIGSASGIIAVNDQDHVLMTNGSGSQQKILDFNMGQESVIPPLPMVYGQTLTDMNNQDHVTGWALVFTPTGAAIHTFLYENGITSDLGGLAGYGMTIPEAINDHGVIVGTFETGSFIIENGTIHDLSDSLPAGSGWTSLDTAMDINNSGQIIGIGVKDGVAQGYLMTPATGADTTPPVISAPASIIAEATGQTTAVPAIEIVSAVDDIDGPVPVTHDAPAVFPLGTTTVTFTASDAAGNTATATVLVTVQDTSPPSITAPADVNAQSPDGNPVAVNIGQATATDIFSVTITNDAPAAFPIGETTVIWTATDANGNSATATQLVTVSFVDTVPPVVSAPPDVTVEASGVTTAVILGAATATDNVDGSLPVTNDAPAAFALGTTVVTYSATDEAGNIGSAAQDVTVEDTTPPQITAPTPVNASSPDGNPVPVAIGQPTATDLFGPITVTNDAPAVFPVGTTLVTWTAMDANGNTAPAFQAVSVTDDRSLPGLPPDPGPTGKATLEGIDSDGDGVRDDVQRWIALTYPDSEKARAALTQMAGSMQQFLLDASDPVKSIANAIQRGKDLECISYIRPSDFYDIAMEYRAIFINTGLRSDAWLQADRHLSGHGFPLLDNPKLGCNFDPDVMPN